MNPTLSIPNVCNLPVPCTKYWQRIHFFFKTKCKFFMKSAKMNTIKENHFVNQFASELTKALIWWKKSVFLTNQLSYQLKNATVDICIMEICKYFGKNILNIQKRSTFGQVFIQMKLSSNGLWMKIYLDKWNALKNATYYRPIFGKSSKENDAMELSGYNLYIQQDGAPPHYVLAVREWLKKQLEPHGLQSSL